MMIFFAPSFSTNYLDFFMRKPCGHNEIKNIDIVKLICKELGKGESLITYVEDRKGHDLRYAIDSTKIYHELGWLPDMNFDSGIKKTIKCYLENKEWWESINERNN